MATFLRSAYQSPYKSRQSIAGRTVLTNSGPYVMRGASAGGVPIEKVRQPEMTTMPVPTDAIEMRQPFNNVYIQRMRQGSMGNANPELYGGTAEVSVNGQMLRVPNALLQQMKFQDSWNQGRSNAVQEFFGSPNPQGMPYSDYTETQTRWNNLMNQNPQWQQDGAVNPLTRARQTYEQYLSKFNSLPQANTERRDAGGRLMGVDEMGARNKARQEMEAANQEYAKFNRRGGARDAAEFERQQLMAMQENFKRATPTYANLPIKETVYG